MRAVVVFGAPAWDHGQPRPPLQRRLETALRIAQLQPDAAVILTGGDRHGPVEAHVMAGWLGARGVDEGRLMTETRARSTRENAVFVTPILHALGVESVTLVTERFHMPRSCALLRRALAAAALGHIRLHCEEAPDALGGPRRVAWALRERLKLGLAYLGR